VFEYMVRLFAIKNFRLFILSFLMSFNEHQTQTFSLTNKEKDIR